MTPEQWLKEHEGKHVPELVQILHRLQLQEDLIKKLINLKQYAQREKDKSGL